MYVNTTSTRVRYAETDQMSVVYNGIYPQYFEIGRVEALRELGMTYRQMEEEGIMLPVLEMHIKFIRPALYDNMIYIKTFLKQLPDTRIKFDHEIYNEEGQLLTTGWVQLVFVNKETRKPMRAPEQFIKRLKPLVSSSNGQS